LVNDFNAGLCLSLIANTYFKIHILEKRSLMADTNIYFSLIFLFKKII
jgi:hypothetical protein